MKQRIAKRWIRVRTIKRGADPRTAEASVRWILAPHRWKRLRNYYDKYDTSQVFEHDPNLGARARVARRKPRAGRKRR